MIKISVVFSVFMLLASGASSQDFEIALTEWGVPDLQGVWRLATVMPFERPVELGEKRAYSEAEAVELELIAQKKFDDNNEPLDPNRPPPEAADSLPNIGNYDLFWREDGQFLPTINGEFRTSAITDPANGRIPEKMAGVDERLLRLRHGRIGRNSDGPEGRSLGERCLISAGSLSGPVMAPVIYNSNLQFVQSPGYVAITAEMVHDTRIIRIVDERGAVGETHRKWMGDSIGRWEGDTLVVETKYYNTWHTLRGSPVENLTVVETFRQESNSKLIYGFTVDDPSVFTAQFSGEYPLTRLQEAMYEYACHEGNYGMVGILAGARKVEQAEESD
ncbi:MAG: hypothetical protein COA96_12595 [SAR86 cluster bacterium]|uniref:Lipocalin-like domain-containing protein n=1 Tax=SAR86 cluster bacterium TaxID=2030880 RepID=A0A2A5AUZ8_9GAMM|nr:MAG: hypothetical protein COA96_12595 [SAR86 cluster bacterium]